MSTIFCKVPSILLTLMLDNTEKIVKLYSDELKPLMQRIESNETNSKEKRILSQDTEARKLLYKFFNNCQKLQKSDQKFNYDIAILLDYPSEMKKLEEDLSDLKEKVDKKEMSKKEETEEVKKILQKLQELQSPEKLDQLCPIGKSIF